MNVNRVREVIALCAHPEYDFVVLTDGRGEFYLQASYLESDVDSGNVERQLTRRWFLSPEMTESEIVQTAFKCVITSAEHRVREWFRFAGNQVFSPHFDVHALWQLAEDKKFCHRHEPTASGQGPIPPEQSSETKG